MKILVLLISYSFSLYAYSNQTYQEYLEAINYGEEKIDYSETLIKHDEIHKLIPVVPTNLQKNDNQSDPLGVADDILRKLEDDKNKGKNISDIDAKLKNNSSKEKNSGNKNDKIKPAEDKTNEDITKRTGDREEKQSKISGDVVVSTNEDDYYISPSLGGATLPAIENSAQIEVGQRKESLFDIYIGADIKVRLNAGATNVQPGYIAFEVLENVVGRKRVLPVGSSFFGQPKAVNGSTRLFTNISKGITPDGLEFSLSGIVRGVDGKPGLNAVVLNDGRTLNRSINSGVNNFGGALVGLIPDGLVSNAARASADQIVKEKGRDDDAEYGGPVYIVEAEPQEAFVQIEATF